MAHEFAKRTNGNLLVGGQNGVFEYSGGTSWVRISTVGQVNSIVVNSQDIPCLATGGGFVILYKNSPRTFLNNIYMYKIVLDTISDYVWLGSVNTLHKEKGSGFFTYLNPPYTFLSSRADAFCVDEKNSIKWMGYCTTGNPYGISKMDVSDNITNITTSNSNLPASLNMLCMGTDTNGVLYVGTNFGLLIYNGSTFTLLGTSNSTLPNNFIYDICCHKPTNTMYLGHGAGLSAYNSGVFTNTTSSSIGFTSSIVGAVTTDKNGTLWAGCADKVAKYTGSSWQIYNYTNTSLPNDYVRSLSTDTAANLWIGWAYDGISKLSGTTPTNYNMSNSGIRKDEVMQVRCDKQDNVWISYTTSPSALGISRLNAGSVWDHYYTTASLNNNYVNRIDVDKNNLMWIATRIGITTYDRQFWGTYTGTSDLQLNYNYVTDIDIHTNDDVVIGTRSDISTLKTNNTWVFDTTGGSGGLEVYSVKTDNTNKLYGGFQSGFIAFNPGPNTSYSTPNPSYDIAVDALNNKWIASNLSVHKFNGSTFTQYNRFNSPGFKGLSPASVSYNDITDEIWVGTLDSGVNVFNGTSWINYEGGNYGVPYHWGRQRIYDIANDRLGNTWLATSKGLLKHSASGFTYFDSINSAIPNEGIIALDVDTSNNVWCAHNKGIFMFDGNTFTTYDSTNSPLISVAYQSIKVNSQNVVFTGGYNDLYQGGGTGLYAFYPDGVPLVTSANNIQGAEQKMMNIFPNPARNIITIETYNSKSKNINMEIYNVLGERLSSGKISAKEVIDISAYTNGIYIIVVRTDQETWSEKIIKQ
jgi:ligand-binding sensor domain-containing protein